VTRRRALQALAVLALVAACSNDGDTAVEPVWGKQACAHCAMVLSDRRFGAQLVAAGGDRFFFDDPGCMVLFLQDRGLVPARAWVRDAESGRWLDVHAARYVAGAPSPMDFGFEARAGDGIAWDAMRTHVIEKAKREP
jgi:copper chaperone NosL